MRTYYIYKPSGSLEEVEIVDLEYEPTIKIKETEMEEKQVSFTLIANELQLVLPSYPLLGLHQAN